jgi:hypothetical protein
VIKENEAAILINVRNLYKYTHIQITSSFLLLTNKKLQSRRGNILHVGMTRTTAGEQQTTWKISKS